MRFMGCSRFGWMGLEDQQLTFSGLIIQAYPNRGDQHVVNDVLCDSQVIA